MHHHIPSVSNIFGAWLEGFLSKPKFQILVGALHWTIWLSINGVIFNRTTANSFMHVGYFSRLIFSCRLFLGALISSEASRCSL